MGGKCPRVADEAIQRGLASRQELDPGQRTQAGLHLRSEDKEHRDGG